MNKSGWAKTTCLQSGLQKEWFLSKLPLFRKDCKAVLPLNYCCRLCLCFQSWHGLCWFPVRCCQVCFNSFYWVLARWKLSWQSPKRTHMPGHTGAKFPPKCLPSGVFALLLCVPLSFKVQFQKKKKNLNPKGWFISLDDEYSRLNFLVLAIHRSIISTTVFFIYR